MEKDKSIDESWKDSVSIDKEKLNSDQEGSTENSQEQQSQEAPEIEINFLNYVSSLVFQAMIFLGELPNPVNENKIEKNIKQSKFLIDTLVMMKEKTQGNLSEEEEKFLESAVYELQMKYVEQSKNEESSPTLE